MVKACIKKNLTDCTNPRVCGKVLSTNRKGQCRYRIGNYRLICSIEDNRLVILALCIGHKREIYTGEKQEDVYVQK